MKLSDFSQIRKNFSKNRTFATKKMEYLNSYLQKKNFSD